MNIKKFLKPDKRKIVIFIILLLILPIEIDSLQNCQCEFGSPCECSKKEFMITAILLFFIIMLFISNGLGYESMPNILFQIILLAIVSYIISCIIVWIYYKVKKK